MIIYEIRNDTLWRTWVRNDIPKYLMSDLAHHGCAGFAAVREQVKEGTPGMGAMLCRAAQEMGMMLAANGPGFKHHTRAG